MLQERGYWKLNFRTGRRKPPGSDSPEQGALNQGVMSGGLRLSILKFSFQVGDVWFCGFYPTLPLNMGFWPRGVMSGGVYDRSPKAALVELTVTVGEWWPGQSANAEYKQSSPKTILLRISANTFQDINLILPHLLAYSCFLHNCLQNVIFKFKNQTNICTASYKQVQPVSNVDH